MRSELSISILPCERPLNGFLELIPSIQTLPDAPHQPAPRLEVAFFKYAARSSAAIVQRCRPSGGYIHANAVTRASASVSYCAGRPERATSNTASSTPACKYAARVRHTAVRPIRIAGKTSVQRIEFQDETVYLLQERRLVGGDLTRHQFRCMLGKDRLPCLARPSTNLAVRDERQATQVIDLSGMVEVSEEILKTELQTKFLIHVAVQHYSKNLQEADVKAMLARHGNFRVKSASSPRGYSACSYKKRSAWAVIKHPAGYRAPVLWARLGPSPPGAEWPRPAERRGALAGAPSRRPPWC